MAQSDEQSDVDVDEHPLWTILFFVPLYAFMFAMYIELSRRYRIIQVMYWVMPFILGPILFLLDSGSSLFFLFKIFSATAGAWTVQLIRHHSEKYLKLSILKWVAFALLLLNMLEAVVAGSFHALSMNIFPGNALLGVMLLLILANPSNMKRSSDGYNSMEYRMGVLWPIAHSVWDAVFVSTMYCYTGIVGALLHLGVPLLVSCWTNFDQWLQHRTYAICLYAWVALADSALNNSFHYSLPFYSQFNNSFDSLRQCPISHLSNSITNIIAFIFGLIMLFKHIYYETCATARAKQKHFKIYDYDLTFIQFAIRNIRSRGHMYVQSDSEEVQSDEENSEENNLL